MESCREQKFMATRRGRGKNEQLVFKIAARLWGAT
jgi:hypothetical protein